MCYSGKCIWEHQSGDCGFPTITEVRDKYPSPLCTIPCDDTEEEKNKLNLMIEDVREMVAKKKRW